MLVTGSMVILLLSFKDLRRKIIEMIESAIRKVKRGTLRKMQSLLLFSSLGILIFAQMSVNFHNPL